MNKKSSLSYFDNKNFGLVAAYLESTESLNFVAVMQSKFIVSRIEKSVYNFPSWDLHGNLSDLNFLLFSQKSCHNETDFYPP